MPAVALMQASYYRDHAARVRELAAEALTPGIKEHLHDVAHQYDVLAERLMRPPGYEDARHNYAPGSAGVRFAMRHPKYATCPHFSLLRDGENDPWPLERIIDLSAWSATGAKKAKKEEKLKKRQERSEGSPTPEPVEHPDPITRPAE